MKACPILLLHYTIIAQKLMPDGDEAITFADIIM